MMKTRYVEMLSSVVPGIKIVLNTRQANSRCDFLFSIGGDQ